MINYPKKNLDNPHKKSVHGFSPLSAAYSKKKKSSNQNW